MGKASKDKFKLSPPAAEVELNQNKTSSQKIVSVSKTFRVARLFAMNNSFTYKACLSCYGNRNKTADAEGSPRGLQKAWIVKIILGQFSLIRGTLLTRLQKLKTWFLQQTWKYDTSVFA
jgi:hypothetical protein